MWLNSLTKCCPSSSSLLCPVSLSILYLRANCLYFHLENVGNLHVLYTVFQILTPIQLFICRSFFWAKGWVSQYLYVLRKAGIFRPAVLSQTLSLLLCLWLLCPWESLRRGEQQTRLQTPVGGVLRTLRRGRSNFNHSTVLRTLWKWVDRQDRSGPESLKRR